MMRPIGLNRTTYFWLLLTPGLAVADMTSMDDDAMSGVSGQSGLVMEVAANMKIDAIKYFDDGNGVALKDVTFSAIDDPNGHTSELYQIGMSTTGGIFTNFDIENSRMVIGDIVFADDPVKSLGTFIFDAASLKGGMELQPFHGSGFKINLNYNLQGGRFVYRDSGNEFMLDDISASVDIQDLIFAFAEDTSAPGSKPFFALQIPHLVGSVDVGAIRYSNNPANFGRSTDISTGKPLPSFGKIHEDFDLSSYYQLYAGGRIGSSGLTLNAQNQINSANFIYSDDGNQLALKNISGYYNINNLTMDVAPDANNRLGLQLAFDELVGSLQIGSISAGDPTKSFGSFGLDFRFADQVVDGRTYTNRFIIQGQGNANAGNQGIGIQTEWSLADATARYTDDGNSVYLSGISSYGSGKVTLDVTKNEVRNGTQFYDGLRIGFENVKGGYKIDGLRVGKKDAPLQGGTELLLALEIFPSYDFTLNGHYTFAPGGAAGEGITVNADVHITDGNAALISDENGKGLWASGIDYDIHLRDMTIDVTPQGLAIVQAESWSTMDIGDLRVGDKSSGGSFGRVVLQRYEKGSSMVLSAGGAGNVCVGGTGSDQSSCQGSGGSWEMRGDQGITVHLKQIFAQAQDAERRNRFLWETGRTLDASGKAVNGTGVQLIVDNFTTNDGNDTSNDFGIRNDISVDVYQTKVVKKITGYDENGVYGERGQEKIMDASASAGYRYATIADNNDPQVADRPLGFAVKAHTQFKELSIDTISLKHPNVAQPDTIIYGMKFQNFDVTTNLTATPIQ